MNPLYELVPISEKPEKDGFYNLVDSDRNAVGDWFFKDGKWFEDENMLGSFWLRPINPETLKARIREELGKAYEMGGIWQKMGSAGYPDRETYINSVIDKLFKQ